MSITYTPSAADAQYEGFSGQNFDDPVDYSAPNNRRIDAKYFLKPVQDEVLNLIALTRALASANALLNGGFDLAQRQAPGTLTTINDNKCGPDRWRVTRENASVQYKRVSALSEAGLSARYYGHFEKSGSPAGKLLVCQIVEGAAAAPLRGRSVRFQMKMKASGARTMRMAILELQDAGTMDSLPAALVLAWNGAGTDPAFGANLAVIGSVQSQSVTTGWTEFSVTAAIPANSKNILCAVWSHTQFSAGEQLYLSEAALYDGLESRPWLPRHPGGELPLCERYFWKSYDLDAAPGAAASNGLFYHRIQTAVAPLTAGSISGTIVQWPRMRAAPSVSVYAQDGTLSAVTNESAGNNRTGVTANTIGERRALLSADATSANALLLDNRIAFQLACEAEL